MYDNNNLHKLNEVGNVKKYVFKITCNWESEVSYPYFMKYGIRNILTKSMNGIREKSRGKGNNIGVVEAAIGIAIVVVIYENKNNEIRM